MNTEEFQYFGRDLEAMSKADNYHQWILEGYKPYIGKFIADVGSGAGNFIPFLTSTNCEKIYSFEPSENMFPLLQKVGESEPKVILQNTFFNLDSSLEKSSLDTVVYTNVMEHIEDDVNELNVAHHFLKSSGYLLIAVPAMQLLMSPFDKLLGHFRRYEKKSLKKKIEENGFKVIKIHYFDFLGSFIWYVMFVLLKQQLSGGQVGLYDKVVVPIMKRVEKLIPIPFGKNLMVIAQKNSQRYDL